MAIPTQINTPINSPMNSMSDDEVLRACTKGDGGAMSELVRRYAPIVYAAARRQTHDPATAEDVCQAVFVTFARKCGSIRSGASLGAWLLQAARYTSANAMKIQLRRKRHEQAAAQTRSEISAELDPAVLLTQGGSDSGWSEIRPVLDQAIARLAWADQTALVLRYFRGLSLSELATATGTTEEAARKRVSRAMDRLRKALSAAGVSSATCAGAALPGMLAIHAVEPAPAHVIAQSGAAAGNFIHSGVWAMTGAKILIGSAAAAVVLAGVGITMSGIKPAIGANAIALADTTQPAAAPADADWREKVRQVYNLADGHFFKNVEEPFIPERQQLFHSLNARAADTNPDANQLILEQQSDGTMRLKSYGQTSGGGGVGVVGQRLLRLKPGQITGDDEVLGTAISGDWVVRARATPDQVIHGIAEIVSAKIGKDVIVKNSKVDLDVVVVHGTLSPAGGKDDVVTIHVDLGNGAGRSSSMSQSGSGFGFLIQLSQATGIQFRDETSGARQGYRFDMTGAIDGDKISDAALKDLIASLQKQTSLTFLRDKRPLAVWSLKVKAEK